MRKSLPTSFRSRASFILAQCPSFQSTLLCCQGLPAAASDVARRRHGRPRSTKRECESRAPWKWALPKNEGAGGPAPSRPWKWPWPVRTCRSHGGPRLPLSQPHAPPQAAWIMAAAFRTRILSIEPSLIDQGHEVLAEPAGFWTVSSSMSAANPARTAAKCMQIAFIPA